MGYQGIILTSMEKETKTNNWVQTFWQTTEQYQQLRRQSLLVIECRVHFERSWL